MPNPNAHPDDERLAALAGDERDETDARADASLSSHVGDCTRCSAIVVELGTLRASLAELPDLAPSRPLRLVPPAEAPASGPGGEGVGVWVRRLFAPVLTAGAALALVGVVGTTMPGSLGGADSATPGEAAAEFQAVASPAGEGGAAEVDAGADDRALSASPAAYGDGDLRTAREAPTAEEIAGADLPAERSPWPMVLFSGVAVVIGALLLRWILAPRAG